MPSTKGITRQDVLKAFDAAEPTRVAGKEVALLTTREIADALGVTPEAARYHLDKMLDDGAVGKKATGGNGAVWWANVAPRLDPDVAAEIEDRAEHDEFTPLDEA